MRLAFHDACHLAHAQGVRKQPRSVLSAVPGLELLELAEPELCCGSAGLYNLLEPGPAADLGRRKAATILSTIPDAVVTSNPGCALQLRRHLGDLIPEDEAPPAVLQLAQVLDRSLNRVEAKAGDPRTRPGDSARPENPLLKGGKCSADNLSVKASAAPPHSLGRRLAAYALMGLVPVLVLGVVLAGNYRSLARERGVAEGRSEALVVAQTAVEPILDGRPLSNGLSATELRELRRLVKRSFAAHNILRLRLRDLAGNVVFSDDGSGFKQAPDDEALDAARGSVVALLTRLNSDANDSGKAGPEAVEVYLPLQAGTPAQRVGVLEIYLPYAPINADVTADLRNLYRDLAIGLALLYLVLLVITASASRGLRRQVAWNAFIAEHDTLTDLPQPGTVPPPCRVDTEIEPRLGSDRDRHRRSRSIQGSKRHPRPPER